MSSSGNRPPHTKVDIERINEENTFAGTNEVLDDTADPSSGRTMSGSRHRGGKAASVKTANEKVGTEPMSCGPPTSEEGINGDKKVFEANVPGVHLVEKTGLEGATCQDGFTPLRDRGTAITPDDRLAEKVFRHSCSQAGIEIFDVVVFDEDGSAVASPSSKPQRAKSVSLSVKGHAKTPDERLAEKFKRDASREANTNARKQAAVRNPDERLAEKIRKDASRLAKADVGKSAPVEADKCKSLPEGLLTAGYINPSERARYEWQAGEFGRKVGEEKKPASKSLPEVLLTAGHIDPGERARHEWQAGEVGREVGEEKKPAVAPSTSEGARPNQLFEMSIDSNAAPEQEQAQVNPVSQAATTTTAESSDNEPGIEVFDQVGETELVLSAYTVPHQRPSAARPIQQQRSRRQLILANAPLVSARVVSSRRPQGGQGEQQLRGFNKLFQTHMCAAAFLFVLVAVACVVVLVVIIRPGPEAKDLTTVSTLIPRSERFKSLRTVVSTVSSLDDLADESSPQIEALVWLADEDSESITTANPKRLIQRFILAVFFYSTGGDFWADRCSFLSNEHECLWRASAEGGSDVLGVTCNSRSEVEAINLTSNNITGTFPQEIGTLSKLRYLFLEHNKLGGPIPTKVWGLQNLIAMDLGHNRLNSTVPSMGNLQSIVRIDLQYNKLSGPIPESIGQLRHVQNVSLYNNRFTGAVPASLGNLTELRFIDMGSNLLSGTIPSEINNLRNLVGFDAPTNALTGTLPLLRGRHPNLDHLVLWENQLSGSIPSALGTLVSLRKLMLGDNQFTGTLPGETLSNLTKLEMIVLYRNHFIGTVPPSIFDNPNLILVGLGHNELTGSIPNGINNPRGMIAIGLENNHLTGTIPTTDNLHDLLGLLLHSNLLTGTIPLSVGDNNTGLLLLELANNALTGEVPANFLNLSELMWLSVARNDLNGSLDHVCELDITVMTADCDPPGNPEVACSCCLWCCNDENNDCDYWFPVEAYVKQCVSDGSCYSYDY